MLYRINRFTESPINPITGDKYDDSWAVFMLTDRGEKQVCGSFNGCAYSIKTNRSICSEWAFSLCDFIDFNSRLGKNIIVVATADELETARKIYCVHGCDERTLRSSEPAVLIHSTTPENWQRIKQCGALKSRNRLIAEGCIVEEKPIGALLGDPAEFSDYIMFGGGVTGEIVVSSRQHGFIDMDINAPYRPGARLYLDAAKIAADGFLLRDGTHLKVKNVLPLKPYLLFAATAESVGICGASTPVEFSKAADKAFDSIR